MADLKREAERGDPTHKAAYLVSFVLNRSVASPPQGDLTKLGVLSVKTLWMLERSYLARLVQLESLVEDRYAEEKRGLRALAREQRRLEREKKVLQNKMDSLRTYHKILSMPVNPRSGETTEEDEDDDDDDEDEEDGEEGITTENNNE